MPKIKKILTSNTFYILAAIITLAYVLLNASVQRTSSYEGDETEIEGIVDKRVLGKNKVSLHLTAREKIICNYYSDEGEEKLKNFWDTVPAGSTVIVHGKLKKPANNTIPNNFNYQKYLYNKGIFYTCTIEDVEVVKTSKNPLYVIKNWIENRIMTFKEKDYLYTMIIGDKSLLDDEVMSEYRQNGVTHLFAISGMHIGLFAMIIATIMKKLHVKEKKVSLFVTLSIWFYVFLAGFSPSVVRAALLSTFITVDHLLDLRIPKVKILLLVALSLIWANYRIIYDIGFIYSFLTTFGLIYSSNLIGKYKVMGVSLMANLYSLPITINNFYTFNLASVFFNIIFVPFVASILYPLCLLAFFLKFLEPLLSLSIGFLEILNHLCARFSFFIFVVPPLSVFMLAMYYFMLLKFGKRSLYKLSLVLIGLILANKLQPLLDTRIHVDFLDVGQGDAIILRSAHNKEVVLIDTGGKVGSKSSYKVSDGIINYLHSLGIDRLDYLILSHGDADHAGEADNILDNLKVQEVYFNCGEYNTLENKLIGILENEGIAYSSCTNEIHFANSKLQFLKTREYDNENDFSSVIHANLNNFKFLFMGDASSAVEKEIINKYDLANIAVLKVGHHGSKTSSSEEFVKNIEPKYSVIQVGKNNRYKHPNKETLENLASSKIYRTDEDGSIMFAISNGELRVETCPP